MNKQIDLVKEFHEKFKALVSLEPTLIPDNRAENRFRLIAEEVEEYRRGTKVNDIENIAKELADILYVVYGTILEHGLQDKMEAIFNEVHRSNMTKSMHEYKMIKGDDYTEPDMKQFFNQVN